MSDRDKAMKFIEIANKRVNRIIKDIRLLSNLSNKRNYEYTEEQIKKIFRALQVELDDTKKSFTIVKSSNDEIFKL